MSIVQRSSAQRVRCAIYTRKSSDEGLEQAFNSLDAQREACAAYILSQASEGWTALPDIYDDGGLSGGTLQRPALQRLLGEVAAGRVDIIVVYKVDRLTRSLFDFAKLVETFDAAGTSFVSVTQSFNTTTSMGRLTLNMLLSFAQFEREVTAERIRDKIAASKARGMWMGGIPPLGYKADGRTLAIVEHHAALVRHLFERYLALGSVRGLADELKGAGTRVPIRNTIGGKPLGGGMFTRGQLYHLIKNVIYTGRIGHRGAIHAGLHPAIIPVDLFDAAQAMLASHVQGHQTRSTADYPSPFAGKIVDEDGEPMIVGHTNKSKVRYRYYVSRARHLGDQTTGMRLPAGEVEKLVTARLDALLGDPLALAALAWIEVRPDRLGGFIQRCTELGPQIGQRRSPALQAIVRQVRVRSAGIEITLDMTALTTALQVGRASDAPDTITVSAAARLTRSGRALRLVQDSGTVAGAAPDQALIRLLIQARRWWTILRQGEVSPTELATHEGVTRSYIARVVRLAFLAPTVTEAILTGRQRAGVSVASFVLETSVAASWKAQRQQLLPSMMNRLEAD